MEPLKKLVDEYYWRFSNPRSRQKLGALTFDTEEESALKTGKNLKLYLIYSPESDAKNIMLTDIGFTILLPKSPARMGYDDIMLLDGSIANPSALMMCSFVPGADQWAYKFSSETFRDKTEQKVVFYSQHFNNGDCRTLMEIVGMENGKYARAFRHTDKIPNALDLSSFAYACDKTLQNWDANIIITSSELGPTKLSYSCGSYRGKENKYYNLVSMSAVSELSKPPIPVVSNDTIALFDKLLQRYAGTNLSSTCLHLESRDFYSKD